MSVTWLSRAWEYQCGSPTKKAVLIALADRCGEEGICWPSYRDIMWRTEFGRTTVVRALEELEVDGVIESRRRPPRADGSDRSKEFQLLIPAIPGGTGAGTPPYRSGTPRGAAAEPREPSVEPSDRSSTSDRRRRSDRAPRQRMQPRRPDGDGGLDDDGGPVLGSDPNATPKSRERVPAAEAPTRPQHAALRLKDRLVRDGFVDPVNVRQLAATLNRWCADGLELATLVAMVDVFAAAPSRYGPKDDIPWRVFINARAKLQADATKVAEAADPTAKFGKGFSRARARRTA